MTISSNEDFLIHELSIDDLDAVAGGSVWGWITHEASSAWHWVERQEAKVADALALMALGHTTIKLNLTQKMH